ncbi:hypothetical protein CVT25_001126 [Psilocybe cyanescens]|uniref:Mob1/phocein n=1 Tax=Psilocybe cyanescens TaxID=93625 RepID=A0A409XB19_PSICY|nr:hypothetical protein CVT25_001126 [Psilocybe cyanescens]
MAAVIQRPLRGSRVSTFYPVKNLPSLASLDSAFQLQEYISLLIRLDVHDVEAIISFPGSSQKDKDSASEKDKEEQKDNTKDGDKDADKAKNEVTVDEGCWIYEQLRRLAQDLSHPLITTLQQECTRASCPEMKAGEWLYLCVAHGNDGAMEQCCAIDYILHTVDSATALLNSPRTFPSRLSIPQTSHRHFSSLARRLGRIFAHAYFHHREAFEQAEVESSLYARFLALTAKFDLVPTEFLVIPSNHFSNEESHSRERDPSPYEYNEHGRGYQTTYQQAGPAEHIQPAQKFSQQEQLGLGGPGHPNAPGLGESSGSSNGGIGESPNSASRSRFGRSRTDTMVFADSDASAIAEELAAKAKAGQLEADYEEEGPKNVRPDSESELGQEEEEEEEEEADLDGDTQFEISLSPEEEINGTFADIGDLPIHLEKTQAPSPDVPESFVEVHPEQEEKQETTKVEEPSLSTEKTEEKVDEQAVPEVSVPVEEEKTVVEEEIPSEIVIEEPKAPESAVETPVSESELTTSPPASEVAAPPSPTTLAAEELHEIIHEVKEGSTPEVSSEPPVTPSTAQTEPTADVKDEIAESAILAHLEPAPSYIDGLSSPKSEPATATATVEPAAHQEVDTPAHVDEVIETPVEVTESQETKPAEAAAVPAEQATSKTEDNEHKSYAEVAKSDEESTNESLPEATETPAAPAVVKDVSSSQTP